MPKRRDKEDRTISKHITILINTYNKVIEAMQKQNSNNLSDFIDKALLQYMKEKNNVAAQKNINKQLDLMNTLNIPVETAGVYWMLYSPWLNRDKLKDCDIKTYTKYNILEKQKLEKKYFEECNTIKKMSLRDIFGNLFTNEEYNNIKNLDKSKFQELNNKIIEELGANKIKTNNSRLYAFDDPRKQHKFYKWLLSTNLISTDKIILTNGSIPDSHPDLINTNYFWGVEITL